MAEVATAAAFEEPRETVLATTAGCEEPRLAEVATAAMVEELRTAAVAAAERINDELAAETEERLLEEEATAADPA